MNTGTRINGYKQGGRKFVPVRKGLIISSPWFSSHLKNGNIRKKQKFQGRLCQSYRRVDVGYSIVGNHIPQFSQSSVTSKLTFGNIQEIKRSTSWNVCIFTWWKQLYFHWPPLYPLRFGYEVYTDVIILSSFTFGYKLIFSWPFD